MSSLPDYLNARRAEVERHLAAALPQGPDVPEPLRQAMAYSLLAPGKRLRPILAVMAWEACGGGGSPWPAACAVEMIHAYSLIHDDLPAMDDDDLRRGRPTCHVQYGEALAILAGDALQALAFEVLAGGYPGATAAACCRELARASGAAGMVGGQADDLAAETCPAADVSPGLLEGIHRRKTGALIGASLRLGVHAAAAGRGEADAPALAAVSDYGRCLGLAFQITDDLLDATGDAGAAGKRVRKDAARGKLTYPGLLGVEESRRRARRLGQEACAALGPLGAGAARLRELVAYVLERDR